MWRSSYTVIAALMGGAMAVGTAQAQDATIGFAHMNSPSHFVNVGGQMMADAVAERTGGAVEIQLFPSGELGESSAVTEQINLGAALISQVGPSALANYVPDFAIIPYPFLFDNYEQAQIVLNSDIIAEMEERATAHNFKVLCYFAFGIRDLYTRDVPVRTPADSEGLRLRVQPSTIYTEMIENAFLAAPTPLPWPEVYSALAQGVIDGAEAPPAAILDQKHHEHATYLTQTNHILDISPIIMSLSTWEGMSGDQQAILQEEADNACTFMADQALGNYEAGIEELRDSGVTIISDIDRAAFVEGSQAIADAFPEWSDGLYERVRAELD